MANKKGLGISKKFADGTVHENGTGKFMILSRFEGEDEQPWLEFQWLSGEKQGTIESNKEINMNASIHKFQTTRRASGIEPIQHAPAPVGDILEEIHAMITKNKEMVAESFDKIEFLMDQSNQNYARTDAFFAKLEERDKLIEKRFEMIENKLGRLTDMLENGINAQQNLIKQHEVMGKLIDKLPTI